jgi:hypothetical protein
MQDLLVLLVEDLNESTKKRSPYRLVGTGQIGLGQLKKYRDRDVHVPGVESQDEKKIAKVTALTTQTARKV